MRVRGWGRVSVLGAGVLVLTLPAAPAWALTYECVDAAGQTIFTDSPSQLRSCAASAAQFLSPSPVSSPARGEDMSRPSPQPSHLFPLPQGERTRGEGVSIPVAKVGRSLVVQTKLNGTRDARLIVDTGAEITVLSHAVALDAGLLPSQTVATVTLNTAGGSVRADVFRVGSVSLGQAEARNVTAAVHDLPDAPAGIDGLLGMTFLDQFLVTLDTQKGELHLRPRR